MCAEEKDEVAPAQLDGESEEEDEDEEGDESEDEDEETEQEAIERLTGDLSDTYARTAAQVVEVKVLFSLIN